jgi:hypothetical protein
VKSLFKLLILSTVALSSVVINAQADMSGQCEQLRPDASTLCLLQGRPSGRIASDCQNARDLCASLGGKWDELYWIPVGDDECYATVKYNCVFDVPSTIPLIEEVPSTIPLID